MKKIILVSFLIFSVISCNLFALDTNMQKDYNTQPNECSVESNLINTDTDYGDLEVLSGEEAIETEGQFFRRAIRRFIKWYKERLKGTKCSPNPLGCDVL